MLKKAGYGVKVVNNGREAFEKYTETPDQIDLIFMDIQMPEMDGLEATMKIREWEESTSDTLRNKGIPIVAMTANAMKGDCERCLKSGMDDYITKPIKREIVFEILKKQIFKDR